MAPGDDGGDRDGRGGGHVPAGLAQSGPTFAVQGSKISLDGTQSLRFDDSQVFDIGAGGFTLALRINVPAGFNFNPDVEGVDIFPIASKIGRDNMTPNRGYELALAQGNPRFQYNCDTCESASNLSGPLIGTGTDVHLAVTFDFAGETGKLFEGGTARGTNSLDEGNYDSITQLVLGQAVQTGNQAGIFRNFNGTITDFYIYDRALTTQEVTDLFNGAVPAGVDTTKVPGLLGGNGVFEVGTGRTLEVGSDGTSTSGANNTFSGTVAGTGNLVKAGSGNWTFGGRFTSTGEVKVAGGTLTFVNSNSFLATTPVLVESGAAISLNGTDQAIGGLSGAGSVLLSSSLTVGGGNATSTFSGAITGSGSLVKTGTGTLTLTGANTYSGGTTVSGGVLAGSTQSLQGAIVNNAAVAFNQTADGTYAGAMSGSGSLTKSGSGTLVLTGANTYTGGTTVAAGTLRGSTTSLPGSIVNNGTVEFDQASDGTFAGAISGTGSLSKTGAGTLTLSGAGSYAGATQVNAGGLRLGAAERLPDMTALTVSQGATFALGGFAETVGSLAGAGSVDLSGNLTVGGTNASTTFSGAISGTGSLTKTGTGTLILSGTNTYAGGTTLSQGALQVSSASLPGNLATAAGTGVTFEQAADGTYAGAISGGGSLTKTGAGTLTLTGASSYTGPTMISAGGVRLGAANRLPDMSALTVSQGATFALGGFAETVGSLAGAGSVDLSGNLTVGGTNASTTFSGVLSGAGSLAKTGTGTLTLTGANTYTGGTTLSQGTLQVSSASLPGNVATAAGAVLLFDQPADGTFAGAISGGGGVTKAGAGTLTLTGATTYTGPTVVLGGVLRAAGGGVAGPVANAGALVVEQAADATIAGPITGTGSLTKLGAGTLTLTGSNSFTGGTTVAQGTLVGSSASLPGNISNASSLVFDQPADGSYAGTVSGAGTFAKRGAGRLTLDGDVTAGTARVDAGDLRVSAGRRLTAQTLTLAGGTVSGNGIIAATLLNTGGTLGPGTSPGTLSIEGSYVQSGGTLQLEIAGRNAGQFDQLVTTGVVDIQGGTIQLLFQDFVPEDGETFALIVAAGGLTVAPGVVVDVDGLTADQLSRFNFAGGVFTSGATTTPGELQAQGIEETSETTTRTSVTVVTTVLANRIRNLITGGGPLSRAPRGTFTQPGGGLAPTPAPSGGPGTPGAPAGPVEVESGASGGDGAGGIDLTGMGVWADADYTKLQDDRDGQSFDAAVTTFLGGLDRIIGERTVVGVGFGYETTMLDFRSFAGGRDTEAYTGIAYAAYALDETFTLSGQVAYGSAANDAVETRGTVTSAGEYDSARYTAGASLLALVPYERWELVGTLGYTFAKEAFDTYVSSRNEVVSPSATRVGLVQVGGEAGYAFEDGVTPYLAMNWTYDHFANDRNDGTGRASDPSGLEVSAGLRLFLSDRLTGGVVVRREFDRTDETSYAGAVNIRYQF